MRFRRVVPVLDTMEGTRLKLEMASMLLKQVNTIAARDREIEALRDRCLRLREGSMVDFKDEIAQIDRIREESL